MVRLQANIVNIEVNRDEVIIKNLTDNDIKKLIDSADRALKKYYLMR